ncbi:MAG: GTPase Era [bacterium]
MGFKSGYIAILGAPNVGKSTLLNALLGEKLAIVSEKPQTTRHRLLGILNVKGGQLLFLDTPGLHRSEKPLNVYMVEEALGTLDDADLVFFLVDPQREPTREEEAFLQQVEEKEKPYFLIINKIDQVPKPKLLPHLKAWQKVSNPREFFLVSAKEGDGVKDLIQKALRFLPEGPAYYPEDQLTDRDLRHLSAESIREKLFQLTRQEIPYSLEVVIDEFVEEKDRELDRITATIYVEKDSQKPIVIGKGGSMLKKVGELSRQEIETLTGRKVFLTLFVKVVKDWTKKDPILRELGYK